MIVCSCHAVTDREFLAAIRSSGRGKPAKCPAGKSCGACMETLERILEKESRPAGGEAGSGDDRTRPLQEV